MPSKITTVLTSLRKITKLGLLSFFLFACSSANIIKPDVDSSNNTFNLDPGIAADEAKDYKPTLKGLIILANNGDVDAQNTLGDMYNSGRGAIQDYKQAVVWYTLAANQGHGEAQESLGLLYAIGLGVTQNRVIGHMWANIAASYGRPHIARDLIAKEMTPQQVEQAQQKARKWIEKYGY